jgi:Pyruvate/2-oxoacid:ferredoxin oxidoreductase delta subunit
MNVRKMVKINEDLCDGCGLCVPACAEGAIQIKDGKARLVSEVYCDGLGACLGECPQDAITIEERDVEEFDDKAVKLHLSRLENEAAAKTKKATAVPIPNVHGPSSRAMAAPACPGSAVRRFDRQPSSPTGYDAPAGPSLLGHWPVQLMLVPPHAPFLKNQDLLVCADCVPFTVPDFHSRYLSGRAVVVGCPKLDDLEFYYEKLKAIFAEAAPRKVTVLRMEVPCCGGIAQVALSARNEVAPEVPFEVHTIGIRGDIRAESVPAGRAAG